MKKILLFLLFAPLFAHAQIITTVVGTGAEGYAGDGGTAATALLNNPGQVAFDPAGNMYIADDSNYCVRKVTTAGIISTFAGNGTVGFSGDGGPATAAQFNFIQSVACDAAGNVYITDAYNARVRKVDPSGIVNTFAGNGTYLSSGDGGQASVAAIGSPCHVAVDAAGNVYITDYTSNRIRKVNTSGIIRTVAGSALVGFGGDGGQATAASLRAPTGVAADGVGNIYIADGDNRRIRKVDPSGIITTIAGTGAAGYSGDGGPATAAKMRTTYPPSLDGLGNLYFADIENNVIRRIVLSSGIITTVVGTGTAGFGGDGGPATACLLSLPTNITFDAAGDAYIADFWNNRIRKVSGISTVAIQDLSLSGATINLYPNPAVDELIINAPFPIHHISLTDVMGRSRHYHHINNNEVRIELKDIPAGIYFAQVNDVVVKQFVKE